MIIHENIQNVNALLWEISISVFVVNLMRYRWSLKKFLDTVIHLLETRIIFIHENFYENGGSDGGENGGSTTPKLSRSELQGQIVEMMLSNPRITKKEMAEKLGLSMPDIKKSCWFSTFWERRTNQLLYQWNRNS